MGSKLYKPELTVIHIERDLAANPIAIGTAVLADLPTGFVIQSMRISTSGVPAGATIALGEDNGGDADGYLVAADPADPSNVRCNGALLYDAVDKHYNEYVVADATDGLLATVAVAAANAGKLEVFVVGYQS